MECSCLKNSAFCPTTQNPRSPVTLPAKFQTFHPFLHSTNREKESLWWSLRFNSKQPIDMAQQSHIVIGRTLSQRILQRSGLHPHLRATRTPTMFILAFAQIQNLNYASPIVVISPNKSSSSSRVRVRNPDCSRLFSPAR
jgi:hypothetical protein